MEVAQATKTHEAESLIIALSTTPSYVTLLPEGDAASGNVSLVAYVTDRFLGRTRSTLVVSVGSLADSFANAFGRRRLAEEPDAFADFMLNLTSSLLGASALVGDSEGAVANVANLASVVNSPSGAAGMSAEKTTELIGSLVSNMLASSATIESSAESVELLMGSMGSVANGQAERMDGASQDGMFGLSLGLLGTASNPNERVVISDSASYAACSALATLVGSEYLFGPSNLNATNNSAALSEGLNLLASGKLVDRYAGMAATATACSGLLVSASKLDASDTDGAPIAAGNSSFTMPGNFSKMANISDGDTVETSAQVLTSNPHRGASGAAVNTDVTSLSMLVKRKGSSATGELPVKNLSAPISIKIPLHTLGAASRSDVVIGANESWGLNVSCTGAPKQRAFHQCPGGGAAINYTCEVGAPYDIELMCNGAVVHLCRYWNTELSTWSGDGCEMVGVVTTGSGSGFIICNCTHLTDFASQLDETLELAANVVSSIGSLSIGDILKNVLVLIVLLVVWGAMVVACIYSRYLDGLDKKKVVPFGQLPEAQMDAALLRARLSERRRGSSEEAARDGDDTDDSNAGTGVLGHGSNAVYEDMADFFAKGDGTDYGQHPDTLTPKALARRLQLKTLQFSVVAEQAKATLAMKQHKEKKETKKWRRGRRRVAPEAVLSNEQLLEVMPLLSRSKHSADPPCL